MNDEREYYRKLRQEKEQWKEERFDVKEAFGYFLIMLSLMGAIAILGLLLVTFDRLLNYFIN